MKIEGRGPWLFALVVRLAVMLAGFVSDAHPDFGRLWLSILLVLYFCCVVHCVRPSIICPHCSSNMAGCNYENTGTCPAQGATAENAAILAGLTAIGSTAIAAVITIKHSVAPRFMRIFDSAALSAIVALSKKPASGSAFKYEATTPPDQILAAVGTGSYSMEQALVQCAKLIHENKTSADTLAKLKLDLELIRAAKDVDSFRLAASSSAEAGALTFIAGRVSNFIYNKEILVKVNLQTDFGAAGSSSTPRSSFAARICRFDDPMQFAEWVNLMTLFLNVLGVCTSSIVCHFWEYFVYDVIRHQGHDWQVAFELVLIIFRRIEDSGGQMTIGTAYEDVYLNSAMAEATRNAYKFYKCLPCDSDGAAAYNGKFTSSSKKVCPHFNKGENHPPASLFPDTGTCRMNHICDKFVDNKGPYGRCMGSHSRLKCTNDNACDEPIQ